MQWSKVPGRLALLVAALLVVAGSPAAAQTASYSASADATGLRLRLFGDEVLRLAEAGSEVTSLPSATASGLGATLADDSRSSASVTTVGATESDGENCALPELPEPAASVLDVDVACSSSLAELTASLPSAEATSRLAGITLDGSALADALADTVLLPLTDALGDAFAATEDTVISPVQDELEQQCAGTDLPDSPVNDVIDQLPVDPVNDVLPDDDPCAVLFELLTDAPTLDDVDGTLQAVRDGALGAVSGLDALSLAIDSQTDATSTDADASASASYATVDVTGPSLAFADALLDTTFESAVQPFLDDLAALLEPLGDNAPDVTPVAEAVTTLRDQLDLALLTSDEPIVTVTVLGSEAAASVDRATGEATSSGSASVVEVTLSQALADLLGVEREITVEAGDEVTVLEGTPLESTVSVGTVTTEGGRTEVVSASLALITGADGGVGLDFGNVVAEASGSVGPAPGPEPELPTTGGGFALLGLTGLLGGALLRRRS